MRRTFLSPFKLVAMSMSLLGLLLFAGCAGENEKNDLLTLFAGQLEDGNLVEACQELSNICAEDNMGCLAFDLFCGGTSQEEICAQLERTCVEQNVGCDVFRQQCEDPYQLPGDDHCCDLAQRCLAEMQHPCEDGQCDPTINQRCEGDPETGVKCEETYGGSKCGVDENGDQFCDEDTCADGNCEMPVWLPQVCEEAMQVCGGNHLDGLAAGVDPYSLVEQYCGKPEPIDPNAECCAAVEMCISGAGNSICEPSDDMTEECKIMEPCQRAMEICQGVLTDNAGQYLEGDIFVIYERVCQQPPPQQGKCCDLAQMCINNGKRTNEDPATGGENDFCVEAREVCAKEFADLDSNQSTTSEPKDLMEIFYQFCQPEEPPQPVDDECCAWAQMCAYRDQECAEGSKDCQPEECVQMMQKCGADFDPADPEGMINQACR